MTEFKEDPAGLAAGEAWSRVRKMHTPATWDDWLIIGAGLMSGRAQAMLLAGCTKPVGKAYVTHFSAYLKRYGLDSVDKSDRAKLLLIMNHIDAIVAWRSSLPEQRRVTLNSPSAIWKNFQMTLEGAPKPSTLKAIIARLLATYSVDDTRAILLDTLDAIVTAKSTAL